jgi:hypothetical protein
MRRLSFEFWATLAFVLMILGEFAIGTWALFTYGGQ